MLQDTVRTGFSTDVYKKDWQYKDGDLTVTRSCQWSAPGCHQGCNVLFYTNDEGKLVKIEGDLYSPVNSGRLCMRCLAMVEAVNHPDRILHPLKRVGERGSNTWEQISFDEAYQLIVDKVHEITEKYGARSIAIGAGTGRNATWQTNVLGSAGFHTTNDTASMLAGDCCYTPRMQAMNALFGSTFIADCGHLNELRFDEPTYRRPDLMIVWANNPVVANDDGFLGHWVVDCMQRGMKLLVVDMRLTWLASRAKLWLAPRPGTDGALALAICNIMIAEGLYDKEFVDNWCYGFDELAERVQEYPPEKVAEITWVPLEKIYAAARLIGTAGVTTLQWGLPLDQTKWADGTSHAVACVQVLTGNIDVPGGFVGINYGYVQSDIRENVKRNAGKELMEGRLGDGGQWGLMRTLGTAPHSLAEAILHACETGDPYPIKMVMISSSNTFVNMGADSHRIYEAYRDNVEFFVVCDLFMTPTASGLADLVLPIAMGCERIGVRGWYTPIRSITKCVQSGEAKGDEQIMLELGRLLEPDVFYWEDMEEMFDFCVGDMASVPIDVTLDQLRKEVIMWPRFEYHKHETGKMRFDGQVGFNTATHRIELYCTMYDMVGMDPLPYYKEPPESPISTPEEFKEYPFVLSTGRRSWEFFHSEHRQLKSMREFHPYPLFEIHPDDAAALGIKEGDWCWLENPHGKCKQRAHVTVAELKGTIMAEHGWWFPERDGSAEGGLFGCFDSQINCLTVMDQFGPSGYGSTYKTQLCKVYKCDPDEPWPTTLENLGRNHYTVVNA